MAINCTKYERRNPACRQAGTNDEPLTGRHLRNKRVLITAGPTWVAIDSVRVISNTASGATGIMLAEKLRRLGAKVTLLLGPVENSSLNKKIRLLRFKFFDELRHLVKKELQAKKYDILIHSAAVSDYRPKRALRGKAASTKKSWRLTLIPTEKIIRLCRKKAAGVRLIGFKFQPASCGRELIRQAQKLLKKYSCDTVVANTDGKRGYAAYIVRPRGASGPLFSKKNLVDKLIGCL